MIDSHMSRRPSGMKWRRRPISLMLWLAACGGQVSLANAPDGGEEGGEGILGDSGSDGQLGPDGTTGSSGGSGGSSGSSGSGSSSGSGGDDSSTGLQGGGFDAGIYLGDGSFFADGAYPSTEGGTTDGSVIDASTPCGELQACCGTLSGSTQSLCNSVAGSGDATNCAAELSQLQGGGDCTGVTVLATDVQVAPAQMASDGTFLFWSSTQGLFAVPVQGGPVTTLVNGPTGNQDGTAFLAVDDVNVYLLENESLVRIPKNGAPATLVNESGGAVTSATSLGSTAYWTDRTLGAFRAPLQGNTVDNFAPYSASGPIGVTSTTVFINGGVTIFTMSGSGAATWDGGVYYDCSALTSDANAVYCTSSPTNVSFASDETITPLGQAINSTYIAFDDTYVYWADNTTVGTIERAPKSGGGATVVARDPSPVAIAVDATSIYWADQQGYMKKIAK